MNTAKKDLYFTIIVATVILLAVVTFWLGGKGNEIVSYISFASAIVSIVLAVVAIIYSVIQNNNSQQNIGEMRTLVAEASRVIAEKADTMADQAILMGESLKQLLETSAKVSGPSTPLGDEKFSFDASNASVVLSLTFYYLAKCHEVKKPMNLRSLAELALKPAEEPKISDHQKGLIKFYGTGVLTCLQCFFESESIVPSTEQVVEIRKLPSGFQDNISKIITSRIQDSRCEPSEKCNLEIGMKKIDAHVEAA